MLHLEHNLSHPYEDNYLVSSVLKGVKRLKGNNHNSKQVLTLQQIHAMVSFLDVSCMRDLQTWCALLLCFHGLLRISSVTVPNKHTWDTGRILTKDDILVTPTGCILRIRHSKTNQFKERVFEAVIPKGPQPQFCPMLNLITFQRKAGQFVGSDPALSFTAADGTLITLTPTDVRTALHRLVKAVGLEPTHYNTHSLRRSGATHLFVQGIPLETIKVLGDWESDCVFTYLKPKPQEKLSVLKSTT